MDTNENDNNKIFQCPLDEEFIALMMGMEVNRNRTNIPKIQ